MEPILYAHNTIFLLYYIKHYLVLKKENTMKKRIGFIVLAILLLSLPGFCEFRFDGLGAGGQLGLVVSERDNWGPDGPAFGFGFHALGKFAMGRFGDLQYIPSFTFWFRGKRWTDNNNIKHEEQQGQVTINLFDVRYFPPTADIPIKPYVGISILPCIVVNTYHVELNGADQWSDREPDPGFNFFLGIDIPVNNTFVPYCEWRMTACNPWAMRVTGGFSICFL
jgi:hypothetical protein